MSNHPTIAYLTQVFPSLTETFIYREVFSLRNNGFKVVTFAIWKPDVNGLSEESKDLVYDSTYVFPISWPKFLFVHLYFLFTQPVKYLSTFFFVLTRKGESRKNRLRTFFHFCEAIYLTTEAKKQGVQHIHAHFSINAATIALIISRMLNITFSFTAHTNFFTDQVILKEKLRLARFVVTISEYSRDFLLHLIPGENLQDKFHIVHCGVSPDKFLPPMHKAGNQSPLIFSISQLIESKGLPNLVKACKILDERGHDFQCIIAGDGPQRPILERLIAESQIQDKVRLVGVVFQEQLADYLNRTDIFVLPCLTTENGGRDGIPVVLMEAMAMAIPVVSTHLSGIPELVEDGQSGLLVPEKDEVALAEAIQRLLEDRELGVKFGKKGRQKIVQEFNIHKSTDFLIALFVKYLKANE